MMKLSFVQYSTRQSSKDAFWRDDFLVELSKYVSDNNSEESVNELLIGLIFVESERASEPLFKPKRKQYIQSKEYISPLGEKVVVGKSVQFDVQVNTDETDKLESTSEKGEHIVELISKHFDSICVFMMKKGLKTDFVIIQSLMRDFLASRSGSNSYRAG